MKLRRSLPWEKPAVCLLSENWKIETRAHAAPSPKAGVHPPVSIKIQSYSFDIRRWNGRMLSHLWWICPSFVGVPVTCVEWYLESQLNEIWAPELDFCEARLANLVSILNDCFLEVSIWSQICSLLTFVKCSQNKIGWYWYYTSQHN